MRVLKLTLGIKKFCIFPFVFQLLVWRVQTDMFLRPDALGSVDLLFDSMPSGRVCTTSECDFFAFSAKLTHTTFCLFYHVVLCVFYLGLIPRFWHSLHIFSHSQVFPLTFLILLSFGSFYNIGIFNWLWFERLCMNIFFLSLCWMDITNPCLLDCYIYFSISLCIQLIAIIIPHSFWN
jgi:hypothetical protein